MSKYIIECSSCGKYVEALTGLFGKHKLQCTCGHIIDVRAEKLVSRTCPHCRNTVVFDQSKGDKAICPVCKYKLNTIEDISNTVKFTCPTCSCTLYADKSADRITCPLCETVVNVQERASMEDVRNKGLASVIKYEGTNDTFVWKHPIEDFNLGSQLIVHESQEAIFFRDGRALDLFGAGRYTLTTQSLPVLEELFKLPTNSDTAFHSEVYFINMTTQMGIKWGTDSKVRLFDPASGLHIEIGACGQFNIRVCDSRKFLIKVVGTESEFRQEEALDNGRNTIAFSKMFRGMIMNRVKSNLAKVIKEEALDILEIDSKLEVLSDRLRTAVNESLESYGLTMPEFYVTTIVTPDDDPNFARLKNQFAERTLKHRERSILEEEKENRRVEAEIRAQDTLIDAQAEANARLIGAQVDAEEMKLKGYTYQQETARKVGMEAMKNGIVGSGDGGGLGNIAGLGITLGAMSGVTSMTREVLQPMMNSAGCQINGTTAQPVSGRDISWDCVCGAKGITGKFCMECGAPKPAPKESWDCTCGAKGITGKFCMECGAPKPAPKESWDCTCGAKGITGKFCMECGAQKPKPKKSWDCTCGAKGITGKFCMECGAQKPEENANE